MRFFDRLSQRRREEADTEVAVAIMGPDLPPIPGSGPIRDGGAEDSDDAEEPDPEVEEPEEITEGEPVELTAIDPGDVTADLANRLAALDRSEMVASGRNLAQLNARALLATLQSLSGALWVAGPLNRPTGWAVLRTPGDPAQRTEPVLTGTVSGRNRRKGVAARLLAEASAYAREAGHPSLSCTVWTDSPAEAFVRAGGFAPAAPPVVVRRQDLHSTTERLRRIQEDAASYGSDYELEASEDDLEGGGTRFVIAARRAISGAAAGAAALSVTDGAPEFALDAMVWVEPAHRAHRLGTLMAVELIWLAQSKARKLRTVQVAAPAADQHLTAILDRLGFRVAGVQVEHRLPLR